VALKVAIVGMSDKSREGIPWDDPEWEVWGLARDSEDWCRFARTFEIHDDWRAVYPAEYAERLEYCAGLYMQGDPVKGATRYPVEAVSAVCERFESSVDYMLALAIHEGAQEIAIYGVRMESDDEYGYQRPNAHYLIGLARGKGITVHIPQTSPLCKYSRTFEEYPTRYGSLS
jgi:hypothetical protein